MKKTAHVKSNKKEVVRYSVYDEYCGFKPCYFVYAKGKRRHGFPMSQESFESLYTPIEINYNEQTRKGLERIIKLLNNSGLWSDFKKDVELFKDILVNNPQDFEKGLYGSYEERSEMELKYKISFIQDFLYKIVIKTIRFDDYDRDLIKKAMEEKRSISLRDVKGYDISADYDSKKNMAWYSEEYRGYGNGHYYIMLDAVHALYVERD